MKKRTFLDEDDGFYTDTYQENSLEVEDDSELDCEMDLEYEADKILEEASHSLEYDSEEKIKRMIDENNESLLTGLEATDPLTSEEIAAVLKDYHSGDKVKSDAAVVTIINSMSKYMHSVIHKKFGTYYKLPQHAEDLYMQAVLGCLKAIPGYSPEKGAMTTWFLRFILHELQDYVDTNINKTSTYYASMCKTVLRCINRFEDKGIAWDDRTIATESGLSLHTVKRTLEIIRNSNEMHYENFDALEKEMNETFLSPEEIYAINEEKKVIEEAVSCLTNEEKTIVTLTYGLGLPNPCDNKEIERITGLPKETIRRIRGRADIKLRSKFKYHPMFQDRIIRKEISKGQEEIGLFPANNPKEISPFYTAEIEPLLF